MSNTRPFLFTKVNCNSIG